MSILHAKLSTAARTVIQHPLAPVLPPSGFGTPGWLYGILQPCNPYREYRLFFPSKMHYHPVLRWSLNPILYIINRLLRPDPSHPKSRKTDLLPGSEDPFFAGQGRNVFHIHIISHNQNRIR